MKKRIILSAVLSLAALANSFACTNLIVGKNASTDGSTIVSYSADSYGLFGELYHYHSRCYQHQAERQHHLGMHGKLSP